MFRLSIFHCSLLLLSCFFVSCDVPVDRSQLFQSGTTDWLKEGNAEWHFEGEELVARLDSGAGFVMTKAQYDNFELTVEFKPDSTINSGVFLRCQLVELSATECYEINISDLHANPDFRTGAIVTRQAPMATVPTIGQWNIYKVRAEGKTLEVWLNGEKTASITDANLDKGYIGLQALGSGEIRFREALFREL